MLNLLKNHSFYCRQCRHHGGDTYLIEIIEESIKCPQSPYILYVSLYTITFFLLRCLLKYFILIGSCFTLSRWRQYAGCVSAWNHVTHFNKYSQLSGAGKIPVTWRHMEIL